MEQIMVRMECVLVLLEDVAECIEGNPTECKMILEAKEIVRQVIQSFTRGEESGHECA